jgi:S-adenosylmethionine:tRNA ribosyltransferase-isomerase
MSKSPRVLDLATLPAATAQLVSTPLPPELRAGLPAEMRGLRRDHVRLLVVDRDSRSVTHTRFDHIGEFLREGDLLVVNTSRTLPAAVPAHRADGSIVQLRPAVRRPASWDVLAVLPRPPYTNVDLSEGEELRIGDTMLATVRGRRPDIPLLWELAVDRSGLDEIVATGDPIRYSYVPRPIPLDYYQTVYAGRPGSAEMASAGRPFSRELLLSLRARGIDTAEIILHTGLSSYQDDDFDLEHHLYEEWYSVPAATAQAVGNAKRVIAVGTTVVRALETAAGPDGVAAQEGWTSLQVHPDTKLQAVDGMVTGMHEPQASHFDILQAFVDDELLGRAYREAVEQRYLWHEFGDSMLIL